MDTIHDVKIGYIFYWPDYQQYEDLPDFYHHAWHTDDTDVQMCVVEKDWLDAAIKREEDKKYAGFWDM